MERRDAIKSISAVLGYSLTPAMIGSLAASCNQSRKMSDWTPGFFSKEDAWVIATLGETFLPKTETPGSKEVGAHLFVDVFLDKVAKPKDRDLCVKGFEVWKANFKNITGVPLDEADQEAFNKNISSYYHLDQEKKESVQELLGKEEPENGRDKETYRVYSFLKLYKRLIMLGYYVSEEIGENVLSYLPVPGDYEGCIPVESVGNAWSLG